MGVVLSAVGTTTLLGSGLQKSHLQQRAWIAPDRSVLAVIRGYGGQATGDIAMETVTQELMRADAGPDGVLAALAAASARLRAAPPSAAPRLAAVTAAVLVPTGATLLHVGSNVGFMLRGGVLRRLTADHTFDAQQGRYQARIMVQVLGSPRDGVERSAVELAAGDRLVLITESILRAATEDELCAAATVTDVDAAAHALAVLAHDRIDNDSATAVVAAFA